MAQMIEEHALTAARRLGESDVRVVLRLAEVLARLGSERAELLMREAEAIHVNGGVRRKDGELRTLGGTFFQLAAEQFDVRVKKTPEPKGPTGSSNRALLLLSRIVAHASDARMRLLSTAEAGSPASDETLLMSDLLAIQGLIGTLANELHAPPSKPKPVKKAAKRTAKSFPRAKPFRKSPIVVTIAPRKPKPDRGPYLGYARPACRALGSGAVFRPTGGTKPGSHRDGHHH